MRGIRIFPTAEEYVEDFLARGLPEESIRTNDFYRRLIGWVIDQRSPLLYEQDHPDEYTNLSINFNWLLLRNYAQTKPNEYVACFTAYLAPAESSARVNTRLTNARRSRNSPRSPRFRHYEKRIKESEGFENWIGVDGCFERAKSGEDSVCNIGKYRDRN